MHNYLVKKSLFITASMILIAICVSSIVVFSQYFNKSLGQNIFLVNAGTGDNVDGFAWSENIGWISFNATNESSPHDYGVKMNETTGQFSGYAWSSNVGWIYFGPDADLSVYGYTNTNAPAEGWAKHDSSSNAVKGWAKILSLGDDGWLRFDHGKSNPVTVDTVNKVLKGFAWNGNSDNTGIGWVSFNCLDSASCGTVDYKVAINVAAFGTHPTVDVASMSASLEGDPCSKDDIREVTLRWTFDDNGSGLNQLKYRVKVPSISYDKEIVSDVEVQNIKLSHSDGLNYDTSYNWTVEVWDTSGNSSGEITGPAFSTYKHEYPDPDNFTWYVPNPSVKEEIKFTSADLAKYYSNSSPSTARSCTLAACDWKWEIDTKYDAVFKEAGTDTASSTVVIFNEIGTDTAGISLTVTDQDGYACSTSTEMGVSIGLPDWIEGGGQQ